jgi:hypothetical protein
MKIVIVNSKSVLDDTLFLFFYCDVRKKYCFNKRIRKRKYTFFTYPERKKKLIFLTPTVLHINESESGSGYGAPMSAP